MQLPSLRMTILNSVLARHSYAIFLQYEAFCAASTLWERSF
jgi:hypothetical protein